MILGRSFTFTQDGDLLYTKGVSEKKPAGLVSHHQPRTNKSIHPFIVLIGLFITHLVESIIRYGIYC
jgi:hypothetical protein